MRLPKDVKRRRAVERGLEFVYSSACDPGNFEAWGFDYLSCFKCIAFTSQDKALRETALRMGRERAQCWRLANTVVRADIDADTIDRKSTRLNSSHQIISYAVFCL